jgi:hypothetical protein
MTEQDRFKVLASIDIFGDAIDERDWVTARRIWQRLAPFHAEITLVCPYAKYIAEVLWNEHALALLAERQSDAIH